MLSVTKALKPHLHDTTCCQTSLTTGCIVYTNIQPVVKPVWQTAVSCIQPVVKRVVQSVRQRCWTNSLFVQHGCQTCLTNTVWQPVERTAVRSTRLSNRVCQTGCTTRFDNRLNEQCCSFNTVVKPVVKPVWMFVYTIQPVVKPVVQLVWQTRFDNRFDNGFDNRLYRIYKHFTWLSNRFDNRFDNFLNAWVAYMWSKNFMSLFSRSTRSESIIFLLPYFRSPFQAYQ